ncbi:glucosyltransferase domain-containing protein [Candidatus Saccharibacteria bacterium]|nr:glucosyltransferase domain-containing protein [Candidatus Saccharibacteria bacterium]
MKIEVLKKRLLVFKPFIKPFLVVFLIYVLAFLAVLRAGVSFVDDRGRAIFGYAWTSDFNRFSSTAFGLLMNVNDRLLDISPWPQILGLAMLSVVGVMLTYVFCDKKIKFLPLILTTFVGLLPLTVECWLYKFDAPCIALSVLVSVLPILWWPKKFEKKAVIKFSLISLFCMLVMWTTYQASSGVFLVLCLYMALRDYLKGEKCLDIIKKLMLAILVFVIAALAFKFLLPEPEKSYRSNEMLGFSELILGVWNNFVMHIKLMVGSLNVWQMILAGMAGIGMTILVFWRYRMNGFLVLIIFLVALPLSIGAYLLLVKPPLTARSLVGVGMSFVPVLILATKDIKSFSGYVLVVPSLVLLYSFSMFVLAFGNGLADQERWANYRVEDLVSKLSELYPDKDDVASKKIKIEGDIGYSKVMQHVVDKYPATKELVTIQTTGLSSAAWGLTKIRSYHNRPQVFEENYAYEDYCNPEIVEVRANTYYYTISDNIDRICVELK